MASVIQKPEDRLRKLVEGINTNELLGEGMVADNLRIIMGMNVRSPLEDALPIIKGLGDTRAIRVLEKTVSENPKNPYVRCAGISLMTAIAQQTPDGKPWEKEDPTPKQAIDALKRIASTERDGTVIEGLRIASSKLGVTLSKKL